MMIVELVATRAATVAGGGGAVMWVVAGVELMLAVAVAAAVTVADAVGMAVVGVANDPIRATLRATRCGREELIATTHHDPIHPLPTGRRRRR